jgi:hypothetical protein
MSSSDTWPSPSQRTDKSLSLPSARHEYSSAIWSLPIVCGRERYRLKRSCTRDGARNPKNGRMSTRKDSRVANSRSGVMAGRGGSMLSSGIRGDVSSSGSWRSMLLPVGGVATDTQRVSAKQVKGSEPTLTFNVPLPTAHQPVLASYTVSRSCSMNRRNSTGSWSARDGGVDSTEERGSLFLQLRRTCLCVVRERERGTRHHVSASASAWCMYRGIVRMLR